MKVSVIVPVYNTRPYLRRCLDALVTQTLPELELILVDDGSTDGSAAVLAAYARQYPERIVLLRQANGGQGAARNAGLRRACGDYIGFADSDDYVAPKMYRAMYEAAVGTGADLVECRFHYLQEGGRRPRSLRPRGTIKARSCARELFIDPQVSPWNKLYKRTVLEQPGLRFPEGLIYEDTAFYLKTIPHLKKTAYLDEPFVHYFYRQSSTMNSNKAQRVGDIFPVLEDILQYFEQNGFRRQYRSELEYFCTKLLLCSSLSRIGRISDPGLERTLREQSFAWIEQHFPAYKQNPYYQSGPAGAYVKLVNRRNSYWFGRMLGKVMKG